MGITINGCHFSGNSICIVNGKVVSGGNSPFGEPKKYDERKNVSADGIDRITVDCDCADVKMEVKNTSIVEAHFFGSVCTNGKLEFDVSRSGSEIRITVKLKGNTINSSLELHISIPAKMFKMISAKSQNGDVVICEDVCTRKLKVKSENGNLEATGYFEELTAKTMNGNAEVVVNAKTNVELDVSSMNGNVSVELHNIAHCSLSTSSMNGSVRNRYNLSTNGYIATGELSTMNGNVKVR